MVVFSNNQLAAPLCLAALEVEIQRLRSIRDALELDLNPLTRNSALNLPPPPPAHEEDEVPPSSLLEEDEIPPPPVDESPFPIPKPPAYDIEDVPLPPPPERQCYYPIFSLEISR